MEKREVLTQSDFGRGTAEHDELLWETFVETDLWSSVVQGKVDVVLGAKGAGKSAIYSRIFRLEPQLRRRGIVLVGAEEIAGEPVFGQLPSMARLTGRQFVGLWKLYLLALSGEQLRKIYPRDSTVAKLVTTLQEAKLLPPSGDSTLIEIFRRVLRYVQFDLGVEVGIGMATASARITLHEPTPEQKDHGVISVHRLMLSIGEFLTKRKQHIWLMVDRLDAAFAAAGEDLESMALRALIQTYVDFLGRNYRVSLKLFLREDLWNRILRDSTGEPIVGANAVEARVIRWSDSALISLMASRLVYNKFICRYYDVRDAAVRKNAGQQRDLLERVFPTPSDLGAPASNTLSWILDSLRDGTGHVAPRELVVLLSSARQTQLDRIELGLANLTGSALFEPITVRDAIQHVSEFRLFQTLCLEYPHLTAPIGQLRGNGARHTTEDLTRLWRLDTPAETTRLANQLRSLGFFGVSDSGHGFQIAPLYRPALAIHD